jgi:hypothetical protein
MRTHLGAGGGSTRVQPLKEGERLRKDDSHYHYDGRVVSWKEYLKIRGEIPKDKEGGSNQYEPTLTY